MNKRIQKKLSKLTRDWTTFAGEGEWRILHLLHRAGSIYDFFWLERRGRGKEWRVFRKRH